MDCTALDRMRYLKVQFLAEERENGSIVGNTRISLDDENQIRHAKLSYADSAFRRELSSGTNTKGLKTIQPYMIR